MELIYSKHPKDDSKIIKMLSREEELQMNQGKWVANDKAHKNHKKYDRKGQKRELRSILGSFLSSLTTFNKENFVKSKIILTFATKLKNIWKICTKF